LKEGDIVIARTGATTGYAKRIKRNPDAVFASYLVRLRISEEHDNQYIGCVVESDTYKQFIKTNLSGAAQPNANAQVLTSFPVLLPPLPTQRKIAAILSAYDDLIENNTRRIALLEHTAQLLYREWFVHFRFPGHESIPLLESELGLIPEGWVAENLGEVCHLVIGQSPKSEFYNEDSEGLPFHQGVKDFGNLYPTTRVYCTVTKRVAETGDILFSVRAPVGRMNITDRKIVIGRGLHAIRSKTGNQTYIFLQLKDKFHEEDMMGGGTIFKSVTKADVLGIQLLMPPDNLLAKFEQIATPMLSETKVLTDKNANLRRTRDLLLPRLISGQLDVSELDISWIVP